MTLIERATIYIHRLCEEIGVTADSIYNQKTGAWYFAQGSCTIEVFLTTQKNMQRESQTFIRCTAALCDIPQTVPKQIALYKTAMGINATYLGFKISADEQRGLICIIAERNISGMDYDEMVALINDLSSWADKLVNFMKEEFSN